MSWKIKQVSEKFSQRTRHPVHAIFCREARTVTVLDDETGNMLSIIVPATNLAANREWQPAQLDEFISKNRDYYASSAVRLTQPDVRLVEKIAIANPEVDAQAAVLLAWINELREVHKLKAYTRDDLLDAMQAAMSKRAAAVAAIDAESGGKV